MVDNNYETVKAWGEITIERLDKSITKNDIYDTGDLQRSLHIDFATGAECNIEKIVLSHLYYGIFVDMGVGRGVKKDMFGKGNHRKPKPWRSKVIINQTYRLSEILLEKTGERAVVSIIDNLM
jgi:hypothetical protein